MRYNDDYMCFDTPSIKALTEEFYKEFKIAFQKVKEAMNNRCEGEPRKVSFAIEAFEFYGKKFYATDFINYQTRQFVPPNFQTLDEWFKERLV